MSKSCYIIYKGVKNIVKKLCTQIKEKVTTLEIFDLVSKRHCQGSQLATSTSGQTGSIHLESPQVILLTILQGLVFSN